MTRPTPADYELMRVAMRTFSPVNTESWRLLCVGAVIVDQNGEEISRGYSRETDSHVHAEESALAKRASDDPRLKTAAIYSTLEHCSQRKSRRALALSLSLRPESLGLSWRGGSPVSSLQIAKVANRLPIPAW
jgi:pyrimidine deaminase RibD-like protein